MLNHKHFLMQGENGNLNFFVLFLAMMLFFFICAAAIEKYKPQYGHETVFTIIFGVSLSLILYATLGASTDTTLQFNSNFFFNFFLPPIIFNSGFTMYKKTFFKNLGNVAVFGLMVTLVCFVIYSLFGWLLLQKMGVQMSNPYYLNSGQQFLVNGSAVENPQQIQLPTMQILLFTALLCSSDVVAAVSIVDYTQQPKLYSCIFGEGVFNDIVSIILFNTVIQLQSTDFTAATPFVIIGEFFMLGFVSLIIGLFFGFLTSFIFKHCRFLRVNPIIETFLIFAFSLVSYFVSDLTVIFGIEMSGIISLLTCGIVQSHYTYYNMSPQGKICATLTISFMGTAAEAGVYSYIGIALFSKIPTWWSFEFISLQFIILVVGRIIAVFGTFYLFRLCFKSRNINFRELCFITYAGMIRGAIAFALVLKIPVQGEKDCSDPANCLLQQNYDVLVSTTLILVMMTTILFGFFMGKVQKLLVPSTQKDKEEYIEHQRAQSAISRATITRMKSAASLGDISHYEEIVHPNEEAQDDDGESRYSVLLGQGKAVGWVHSRFVRWFVKFDEQKLRPFFIKNYTKALIVLADEYQGILQENFNDDQVEETVNRLESVNYGRMTSRNSTGMNMVFNLPVRTVSYIDPQGEFTITKPQVEDRIGTVIGQKKSPAKPLETIIEQEDLFRSASQASPRANQKAKSDPNLLFGTRVNYTNSESSPLNVAGILLSQSDRASDNTNKIEITEQE